jgi:uncharacterized protein
MKFHLENKLLMKKIIGISLFLLGLLILQPQSSQTQNLPEPMSPPRLVNDFAGFLSPQETNSLEGKLRNFNNQTSTQIYIIVVNDLLGYAPGDYAAQIGDFWEIGQEGKDNGAVILVKPKTSDSKGEIFIATGYGLEGAVPDAIANRIIDQEIIPAFKNGNYFEGLNQGVDVMISLTKGEFTADQYVQNSSGEGGIGVIGVIILIIIFASLFGGRSRMNRHQGIGGNLPLWILLGMMSSGGRSNSGSFGNFRGGSGGFGGFGGFGGGGGGSFGGGGAGGSW